jgi:hypothetical protein
MHRPLTIFLSYRRADASEVRGLEGAVRLRGVRTWRDVNDLPLGGATEDEILEAIGGRTDGLVLYATPRLYEPNSRFIWEKELPAADARWQRDGYPVIVIYRGTTPAELSARCRSLGLTDFGALTNGTWIPARDDAGPAETAVARAQASVATGILRTLLARRPQSPQTTLVLRSFQMADHPDGALLDVDWTSALEAADRDDWTYDLLPALRDIREELQRAQREALVVHPNARLSVCTAFGMEFPLASRFRIRLIGRDRKEWPQEPGPSPVSFSLERTDGAAPERAVVALGFTRDLHESASAVATTVDAGLLLELKPDGLQLDQMLRPLTEAIGAQLRALASRGVRDFHVLVAGPAPMAVAVGRQLHALGDVTLYYADRERQPAAAFTRSV